MAKKLFVGNFPWKTTEDDLRNMFSEFGDIEEAIIINDRMSGRSKGFGFVTFGDDAAADAAIAALDNKDMGGRPLKVNEARPKEESGSRF